MSNYLLFLFNRFRTWRKAKVQKSKQPLSRENAYALSSIGKKEGHYYDITKRYQEYILKNIKADAKLGNSYVLLSHPTYASPSDKEAIVEFITSLNYTVCYTDEFVILISWKYSPEDFNDRYSK